MKTTFLTIAAFVFTFSINAQNQNVTEISKTTVTTVKDSEGEKQLVKKQNVQQVQNIELKDADSKSLNKDMKQTPIQVTSSIQVTNPDGTTRTVDVDRSAYYEYSGKKYKIALDAMGYSILDPDTKVTSKLRKTSTNAYIYKTKDRTAVGYFDTMGNLVIETYDDKSDKVTTATYVPVRQ